ncbi:MAG: hypothetical protein ABI183_21320 [Polyangiaceae bacterium]
MRRPFLMVLLALGTVAGFGSGFASMHGCHRGGGGSRFEQHVADVCYQAAQRANHRP